jgi:hypothetical protein
MSASASGGRAAGLLGIDLTCHDGQPALVVASQHADIGDADDRFAAKGFL